MRCYNHGRFQEQATFLRRQFLQDGDLRFTYVLSHDIVAQALTVTGVVWLDRIYSPLVTLWVFLGQVLSADHSCRAEVARLIAHRLSRGQRPCSATTGAYCQARKRLPEQFFSAVDLVHKEVWTHLLAYNLIRTIMAQAATKRGVQPRTISFKGTLQTLESFRPLLDFQGRRDDAFRVVPYEQLRDAVALHRVGNRPDRFEPRYRKRKSKRYAELKLPRHAAKLAILKGVGKN
jgi:hypothetical protein